MTGKYEEDFQFDREQLGREMKWLVANALLRYPEGLKGWGDGPNPEDLRAAEELPEEVKARLGEVLDEWEERTRRQAKEQQFLDTVAKDLQRLHPGQWVAIYQQRIIAVAASPPQLHQALAEKAIPRKKAFIRPIPDGVILIPSMFHS